MSGANPTVDEIVDALCRGGGDVCAVHAALAERWDELKPYLVAALEGIVDDPFEVIDRGPYRLHLHAVAMLGYYREQDTHGLLARALSIDPSAADALFNQVFEGTAGWALLRTCDDGGQRMIALAKNRAAAGDARGQAIAGLCYQVAEGERTRAAVTARAAVIALAAELLEADPEAELVTAITHYVGRLQPVELAEALEARLPALGRTRELWDAMIATDAEILLEDLRRELAEHDSTDFDRLTAFC